MVKNDAILLTYPLQMVGTSPAIRALRDTIAQAAQTSAKVLILGETGVGKEVVARAIHASSVRRTQPLVTVNCGGVPETLLESELFGYVRGSFTGAVRDRAGLIQQAHRGTLFLDELGEMSLRMQAMLLRFTETGEVQRVGGAGISGRTDVRLITATNRDLRAQIAVGTFRQDLYYRLNVIEIHVPPLRERGDDIMLLFDHYLAEAARMQGSPQPAVSADAAQMLIAYAWPGNIRELRNVTERLVLQDNEGTVTPADLPREIVESLGGPAHRLARPSRSDALIPLTGITSSSERVEQYWARLMTGGDFWSVVHTAYKTGELTREELIVLVDRGLRETGGN